MKVLSTIIVLLSFTSYVSSQTIDTFSIAIEALSQYEELLNKLYQLRNSGQEDIINRANIILCIGPGPTSPFPSLYRPNSKKGCTIDNFADSWRYSTDCRNQDYDKSIAEYLILDFMTSKSKIPPEFRNICLIGSRIGLVIVRYESRGELVNKKCSAEWTKRVAFLNFINGDPSITSIRFAKSNELEAKCLEWHSEIIADQGVNSSNISIPDAERTTYEEKINYLTTVTSKIKQQLSDLELELKNNRLSLKQLESEITGLNSEMKLKSDSIALFSQLLLKEQYRYTTLQNEYSLLEGSYSKYKVLVTKSLDSISRKLYLLDSGIDRYGNKIENTIKAYEKFDIANTSFLAFNYGLIQAPYNLQAQTDRIIDPVKSSFHTEDFARNFGIVYFRPSIGLFLSNVRLNFNKAPEPVYTSFDFDAAKESLFIEGISFEDLYYIKSGHNLKTINFGFTYYLLEILNIKQSEKSTKRDTNSYLNENRTPQIPILNSLYFMLGISWVSGEIWHYYDGSFPLEFMRDEETNYYVLDKSFVNKTGITLGITYLKPYFQFELGYNTLYSDFYINIGANIPIVPSNEHMRKQTRTNTPHENKNIQRMREDVEELRKYINKANVKINNIRPE